MSSRLELQTLLEQILGSRNVYYQPPESIKMTYPCIKYRLNDININKADDISYIKNRRYELIIMDTKPDNKAIDDILNLPYTSYERHYEVDRVYHDVIYIYY